MTSSSHEPPPSLGLDVAAIITAFVIPPAGLILGLFGRKHARQQGRSTNLSTVAAIAGGVFTGIGLLALSAGIVFGAVAFSNAQADAGDEAFCATVLEHSQLFSDVAAATPATDRWTDSDVDARLELLSGIRDTMQALAPVAPSDLVASWIEVARVGAHELSEEWREAQRDGTGAVDTIEYLKIGVARIQNYCG